MKKLGKKKYEFIETIEAYDCGCSGVLSCWPVCGSEYHAYVSSNDNVYNSVEADKNAR